MDHAARLRKYVRNSPRAYRAASCPAKVQIVLNQEGVPDDLQFGNENPLNVCARSAYRQ